jgi:thioredoxin-dependent peroxiredoxin
MSDTLATQESSDEQAQARQRVGVGDRAPDFALPNTAGEIVRLSDFRGKRDVVLYFYPKDNTSGCTAEACSFRDNYDAISGMDAEVLGISSDSQASHQGFAAQYRLPFPLLSDEGGAVRKRYGVPATLGLLPGRVTYVIDKQGVIRHIFNSQLNIERHIAEALAGLRAIGGAAQSE